MPDSRKIPIAFFLLLGVAFLIFILNMKFWSLLPIYADEIGARAETTRLFYDGWQRVSLLQPCESSASVPIPLVFYPAALVFSFYTLFHDMYLYRLFGIGIFLGTFTLICMVVRRYITRENMISLGSAAVLFLLALFVGVLPSTYLMLRPEYLMLLTFVFTYWALTRKSTVTLSRLWIFLILLVYSMAFYNHPKVIYFFPGLAITIIAILQSRRMEAMVAMAFLLLITGYGIKIDTLQFLQCPEIPSAQVMLNSFNINPLKMLSAPADFFREFSDYMVARDWRTIFTRLTLQESWQGGGSFGYLPQVTQNKASVAITNAFIIVSEFFTLLATIVLFFCNVRLLVKTVWEKGMLNVSALFSADKAAPCLVLITFYLGFTVQLLLNRTQNFYDVGYWFSGFIILNVFSLTLLNRHKLIGITRDSSLVVLTPLLGIHLIAAFATTWMVHNTIYRPFSHNAPILGVNVVAYDEKAMEHDIQGALQLCNLSATMPRLVHDDVTYPYLQQSYHTIPISWSSLLAGSVEKTLEWYKKVGSPGIVTQCSIAAFGTPEHPVKTFGKVCCISLQDTPPPLAK